MSLRDGWTVEHWKTGGDDGHAQAWRYVRQARVAPAQGPPVGEIPDLCGLFCSRFVIGDILPSCRNPCKRAHFRGQYASSQILLDNDYLVWQNRSMETISGDALRGHLEMIVLSLLRQGEAHGYELLQRLEAQGNGLLHMREGSLYPVLYRLEEEGHIQGEWEADTVKRRGPRRRIYSLTAQGKRELAGRRNAWRQFVDVIGRFAEETP